MREIVLIGINHKSAPVEVRECIAFSDEDTIDGLQTLHRHPAVEEVILYSTCNRVELLLVTHQREAAIETAESFLVLKNPASMPAFREYVYVHRGDEAVRHLFRVVASLDSMVVGEPQILGQIKAAYREASSVKTAGVVLNRLLHRAFFVAKRVRTETGIGDRAVSISYAAVELARKIFGELAGKSVLLIGAGEMAELAVEHLKRNRAGDIQVANRTFENGLRLAQRFNGRAIRFEEIGDCLSSVDIIISSTGAPGHVIDRHQVKAVIRKRRNRPVFLIDIAVPRDIDPEINRLPNCYVYDIDDLKNVIDENIEDRRREAVKGERIVDEAVVKFRQWYESLEVVPTVVALRQKIESIAARELQRTLQAESISKEGKQAVERMLHALVNKVLHDPTVFLKKDGMHGDKSVYLDAVRKLFRLDEQE
jgi:glutamyl-tRNA reductase